MCCWRFFCFPRCAEGFNFTRNSFSRWRTPRKCQQKWVNFVPEFRETKESEVGAYAKFLDMFETLYSRRLYSSLQLRWRSNKQAIHVKAYMWWYWNNCCAISPCRRGDKNTSGHWKCKALSWMIRMRESLSNFWTSWFIFIVKEKLLKFSYYFISLALKTAKRRMQFILKPLKDFSSCHPSGVKKDFIKGKAFRLLRTNSS